MKILPKIKNYINAPTQCFIPKCKAICCANAPLPEDFLPKYKDKIVRDIYGGINIGQNDIHDTYNSIIYKTTPDPIQMIGFDENGNKLMGISREMIERFELKSMEEVMALSEKYKDYPNYCAFLTDRGKCNVYKKRPPICKEFGTKIENPQNICPDKTSRKDILKYFVKDFIGFYAGLYNKSVNWLTGFFKKK